MYTKHHFHGQKFDRLTVLARSSKNGTDWICVCSCGNTTVASGFSLAHGKRKSCGCVKRDRPARKTHGMSRSRTYKVWATMKARCNFPSQDSYRLYGERGIGYCKRWEHFEEFLNDMGECPEGHSLDRFNNEKDYSKSNCRWATPLEQANNKRNNRIITAWGISQTLAQWSSVSEIGYTTILQRLDKGVLPEIALRPGRLMKAWRSKIVPQERPEYLRRFNP